MRIIPFPVLSCWILIDLIVVIVGVYCAFLIQSSAEERTNRKEQEKVLSALKMELDMFRISFPQFAQYNADQYNNQFKDTDDYDISDWRFVEPQYAYQIIEYAINIQNNEIIDFELYDQLQKLYVMIKNLEFVEREVHTQAARYKKLVEELARNHPENLARKADNLQTFYRFKIFIRARINILMRSAQQSQKILPIVNKQLGDALKKEIELRFIEENIQALQIASEKEAIQTAQKYFPDISETEVVEIFAKHQKDKNKE
jgi:hypothetical protein